MLFESATYKYITITRAKVLGLSNHKCCLVFKSIEYYYYSYITLHDSNYDKGLLSFDYMQCFCLYCHINLNL